MIEYIWLIPVGMIISTFASVIGIGGGLIWAPFFILLLGMEPQHAAMYSFAVQIVGMGSAAITNIVHKNIYWKLVFFLMPLIFIGELAGSFVNQRIASPDVLQGAMGVMSIFVSLFFAFQPERYDAVLNEDRKTKPPCWMMGLCIPFGSFSGLFSVGIGDNLVPLFRSKLKISMTNAVGTCLFLNLVIALVGLVLHLCLSGNNFGFLNLDILVMCWIGVFTGGQIGPRVSGSIGDNRLKEMFIFILMLIGIHLIYKAM
ncbi:MAG: sulfite exporter TauE/SafE family protein [Spirochaetes bacterium]|nr:sulfite exporter TauE/SafE family protein [Spirochaetota bacterium]MBN2771981.1 sulfite exporter TauE/SafE family protein [Spirochaetota bacterium]